MKKIKRGRKSKCEQISAKEVKSLAGLGMTMQEIGDHFGVDKAQISRNFATAYREGTNSCKMSLRRLQLKSAEKGSVDMQKWLGKQLLGQKEPINEHKIGGEIKVAMQPVLYIPLIKDENVNGNDGTGSPAVEAGADTETGQSS